MAETSGFATDLAQSAYLVTTMRRAISAAQQRSHRYVTLEHLLLALLDDPDVQAMLDSMRINRAAIKSRIADTVNRNLATLYTPGQFDLRASYKVERVLQNASDDARRLNCTEVDATFVLAALARETDSSASDIIRHTGFSFTSAMTWLYSNRGAKVSPKQAAAPAPIEPPAADERAVFGMQEDEIDDGELEFIDEPAAAPAQKPVAPVPPPRADAVDASRRQPPVQPAQANGAARPGGAAPASAAREDAPQQLPRRPQGGAPAAPAAPSPASAPGPRRMEAQAPQATRAIEIGGAAPAPREAPQALAQREGPQQQQRTEPRPEPKVPSMSRLDEMRIRPQGAPAKTSAPAVTQQSANKALKKKGKRPPNGAAPAAPASAKSAAQPAAANTPGQMRRQRRQQWLEAQAGRLLENIPRRMRVAVAERVEVRISRDETDAITKGFDGRGEVNHHEVLVSQAMSVMLRAPEGGFIIETLSPETQWTSDGMDHRTADNFGRWRWAVTPQAAGPHRLQLIVAARSVDENGMTGDTALPDQIISVHIRTNYALTIKRALAWLVVMAVGGVVTELAVAAMKTFGYAGG